MKPKPIKMAEAVPTELPIEVCATCEGERFIPRIGPIRSMQPCPTCAAPTEETR